MITCAKLDSKYTIFTLSLVISMFVCLYYLLTRDWLPQDLAVLFSSWLSALLHHKTWEQRPRLGPPDSSAGERPGKCQNKTQWRLWVSLPSSPPHIIDIQIIMAQSASPSPNPQLRLFIKTCQHFLIFLCLQNFYFLLKGSFQSMQKSLKTMIFNIFLL